MTIPETIDAILAEFEKGLKTRAEAFSLITGLGASSALAEEMIFISEGGSDVVDLSLVILIRGKAHADLNDIVDRRVRAHLRDGSEVTGDVVGLRSDLEAPAGPAMVWIRPPNADFLLDRRLTFDEVKEFEILD